jgi:hypothetical protein
MKQIRMALALAAAVASAGCFQMSTTLHVSPDGSGTIVQRMVFTRAAIEQLKQLGTMGRGGTQPFDPLSEDEARNQAEKLGPGVTYVSSTPIDDAAGQGRETIYSFKDISGLHISRQPQMPGGATVQTDSLKAVDQPVSFSMSRLPNGNSLLTISMPQPNMNGGALGFGAGGQNIPSPEQLAMAKQLFAGAKVNIGVEPAGTLVRSSTPYVSGQHVTLLDVDFDQVMNSAALERLRGVANVDDLRAAVKDVPGLVVNLDPLITIEFAGK